MASRVVLTGTRPGLLAEVLCICCGLILAFVQAVQRHAIVYLRDSALSRVLREGGVTFSWRRAEFSWRKDNAKIHMRSSKTKQQRVAKAVSDLTVH